MIKTAYQLFRVQSAISCNRFFFWLKKIPLVRRLFPDRVYSGWETKQYLMVLVEILKALRGFVGKFLYLGLICVLPLAIPYQGEEILTLGWGMFISILFFLSFFVGCAVQSDILTATLVKYVCTRQMGMNARACTLAAAGRDHATLLLTFTPGLVVAASVFGQSPWIGLLLSLELAAARAIFEFFHVGLFARFGKRPSQKLWYIAAVTLLGSLLAYIPVFTGWVPPMERFLLNPAVCIVLLGCGLWSAAWLVRYPNYRALVLNVCRPENVSSAAAKQTAAQAAFRDVQMRDTDLAVGDVGGSLSARKGYAYLNALFFRRHRRLLTKPVKYELLGIGALLVVGLFCAVCFPAATAAVLVKLPRMLPKMVFLLYLLSNLLGTRICKAMFYNCDISLLKFGWYRTRKVVLQNFSIRLRRVAALNLLVAGALCLALLLPVLVSGAAIPAGELVPFFLSILCLAVFFSVHPLFMYYIFQPYTAQLAVKNPFFGLVNSLIYFLCLFCMYLHQSPSWFAFLVLVATLVYSGAALLLVWRCAPKTFRVK